MKKFYLLFALFLVGATAGVAQKVIRIVDGDSERVFLADELDSLTIRTIDFYTANDTLPSAGDVEDSEFVNSVKSNTGLTLMATQHFVEAGTGVKFAVLDANGTDVTADAKVYVVEGNEHKPLSSDKTYLCQATGSYKFWAAYNGVETRNDALLEVIAVTDKLDVLADENPTSANFLHRALLLEATGVGCQYCPNAISAIHDFYDESEYADQTVLMTLHTFQTGDPLYSDAAATVTSVAGLGASYPALRINFDSNMLASGLNADGFLNFLNTKIPAVCTKSAETAIAVSTAYDEATGVISVTAKVKCDNPGLYKVSVALVQDSVFYKQTGTDNVDFWVHNAGVKGLAPAEGFGFALNNGNTTKVGGVYDYCCEFNASDLYAAGTGKYALDVLKHARVVVYVQANGKVVDNVVACGMNQQVGFEYNK